MPKSLPLIFLMASAPAFAIIGVSAYLAVTVSAWWVAGIVLGSAFMPTFGGAKDV